MSTGIDPRIPSAARIFDYYLGGKDHFEADRAAAEAALEVAPELRNAARASREVVGRIVEHVVEAGIRQIVDIGSGLPTQDNVHEIAHRVDPEVRVVYVDNDELVAAHARALLADSQHVGVVHQDLLRPDDVLGDPALRDLIDLDQPVALLVTLVLHTVPGYAGPHDALAAFREALAPGSFLAITHARNDSRTELMTRLSAVYARSDIPFEPRSREEIARFFGDFRLEPPGLVDVWPYPELPAGFDPDLARTGCGGVARKSAQKG